MTQFEKHFGDICETFCCENLTEIYFININKNGHKNLVVIIKPKVIISSRRLKALGDIIHKFTAKNAEGTFSCFISRLDVLREE
jgi:hypothetical protein